MKILFALLASASLACAQASLAPIGIQFLDGSGHPLAGGKIYSCVAGATCPGTPLATYTDKTGAVAASNPIILDAGGKAASGGQNGIWLSQALYKFVIQTSAGVLVRTYDGVGLGIADPGSNGVMYRSAVNTTRAATLADMTALGVLSLNGSTTPADQAVLNYDIGTGLLGDSGILAHAGAIWTGSNPTYFTLTEGAAPTAPAANKWTWYVDSTVHNPKFIGAASSGFLGWFTTRGTTTHYVLWNDTTGFSDGGATYSNYPALADASPITWDVTLLPTLTATITLNHANATRALNVANFVPGGFYTIIVLEDSTGGAAVSGGSGCTWVTPGGTGTGFLPLVTTASAISTISITYDGTYCYVLGVAYAGM